MIPGEDMMPWSEVDALLWLTSLSPPEGSTTKPSSTAMREIFSLWNSNVWYYNPCRLRHLCPYCSIPRHLVLVAQISLVASQYQSEDLIIVTSLLPKKAVFKQEIPCLTLTR